MEGDGGEVDGGGGGYIWSYIVTTRMASCIKMGSAAMRAWLNVSLSVMGQLKSQDSVRNYSQAVLKDKTSRDVLMDLWLVVHSVVESQIKLFK